MQVDADKCTGCGLCIEECGTHLIQMDASTHLPYLAYEYCSNCGHCVAVCPQNAITLEAYPNFDAKPLPDSSLTFSDLYELALRRRSYRRFQPKTIPEEILTPILQSVQTCPTGCNAQELEISVLTDPDRIRQISKSMNAKFKLAAWLTSHFPIKHIMHLLLSKEKAARNIDGPSRLTKSFAKGEDSYFRNAPAVIILHTATRMEMMHLDAGIAGHHINLACETQGLGCCWIGFHSELCRYFPKIRKLSGIPRRHVVLGTLVVGYPLVKYLRTCPRFEVPLHFNPEV